MKKILITEDNESLRVLYSLELSEMGCEILLAKNGQEAIEKFSQENPDLVIMDLKLPDMNGLDVLCRILKNNPSVPVIINTAYSDYKADFMSWVAREYIVKSSDLTELKNAITAVLEANSSNAMNSTFATEWQIL